MYTHVCGHCDCTMFKNKKEKNHLDIPSPSLNQEKEKPICLPNPNPPGLDGRACNAVFISTQPSPTQYPVRVSQSTILQTMSKVIIQPNIFHSHPRKNPNSASLPRKRKIFLFPSSDAAGSLRPRRRLNPPQTSTEARLPSEQASSSLRLGRCGEKGPLDAAPPLVGW